MRWRLVGPFRGGRALAVAGVPGDGATFYFGAVAGGVWRTRNAGVTWEPLFDAQPVGSIGAIAIARSNPSIIYVGTGEADMRSDLTHGDGVWRSTDAGAHWTNVGLRDSRHIGKIVVDPRDPNVVLVAALGHAYGPNRERGVYRTTNGGATWTRVLQRDDSTGAIDLAADPGNPRTVFAALWQTRRPPWSQYPPNEGNGSGLFKSPDGGATWREITGHGLPPKPVGRIGLAVVRGGRRVYALIAAPKGGGLYRSDDGGATWKLLSTDAEVLTRGWYFTQIFVDPANPDVIYAPNRGIFKSVDGGRTFTTIKSSPGGDDYHDFWIDPKNPAHLIFGSDQGVGVSLDGGKTWSSWYNQPTAQFYHVITDNAFPYHIYGAQQDAGSVVITSHSDYGVITFRDWFSPAGGEAGYLAPDPLDTNIVYGGDTYGVLHRFDRRTGQVQDVSPAPNTPFGLPLPQRKYRFTWTSPVAFDPFDPHTLYFGSQVLLRTTDGGLHWTEASPDLTGANTSAARDTSPPTVATAGERGYGVIYAIAPSAIQRGLIWVGTDNGRIQLTRDAGTHWQDVTPSALAPWSKVSILDASRLDSASAYAAIDRHRLDDYEPYVYRTHDFGHTWTRVSNGLPSGAFVRSVRADPVRLGLLYAGTERGVFVSLDDGDHWQPLQLNLPASPIHDLVVKDTDLVVATHGRSFWVLDDLSPLRQIGDSVLRAPVALARPTTAIRLRLNNNSDTPLPPEEPHGNNAPAGAIIDYWLGAPASTPVAIDILDAQGRLVRHASSTDTTKLVPKRSYIQPQWMQEPALPTSNAGHNRWVWDLRYDRPPAQVYEPSSGSVFGVATAFEPQGPLAPPGSYTVRLAVGSDTRTQPLRVVGDPRVAVPDTVFVAQRAQSIAIWNLMADAATLQRNVAAVRAQLKSVSRSGDSAAIRQAAALDKSAGDIGAGDIGDQLGTLLTTVNAADRLPTAQQQAAVADLEQQLAAAHTRWDALTRADVATLNAQLRKRGAPAIAVPGGQPQRMQQ